MRDRDANTACPPDHRLRRDAGGTGGRRYHCQNWRADVSAVVTSAGKLVEAIKSSAYGIPTGIPGGDTDSDGDWDAAVTSGSYEIRKDPELDNDADAADVTFANSIKSGYQTLGRGVLSSTAVANRKGYAGYENDIYLFKLFHVRNRIFDDALGRWTRRDPLGYISDISLYSYVRSSPQNRIDALGLRCCALSPTTPKSENQAPTTCQQQVDACISNDPETQLAMMAMGFVCTELGFSIPWPTCCAPGVGGCRPGLCGATTNPNRTDIKMCICTNNDGTFACPDIDICAAVRHEIAHAYQKCLHRIQYVPDFPMDTDRLWEVGEYGDSMALCAEIGGHCAQRPGYCDPYWACHRICASYRFRTFPDSIACEHRCHEIFGHCELYRPTIDDFPSAPLIFVGNGQGQHHGVN